MLGFLDVIVIGATCFFLGGLFGFIVSACLVASSNSGQDYESCDKWDME